MYKINFIELGKKCNFSEEINTKVLRELCSEARQRVWKVHSDHIFVLNNKEFKKPIKQTSTLNSSISSSSSAHTQQELQDTQTPATNQNFNTEFLSNNNNTDGNCNNLQFSDISQPNLNVHSSSNNHLLPSFAHLMNNRSECISPFQTLNNQHLMSSTASTSVDFQGSTPFTSASNLLNNNFTEEE